LKKQVVISLFFVLVSTVTALAQQTQFSIATDLGIQRSFKKEQRYWAFGQTVHGHFHFTPKDGIYIWVSYYTNGKFNNTVTATAKSLTTLPQQKIYTNAAIMRFKHVSTGWKRYLKGSSNAEDGWNLYSYAGFGLLLGRVDNIHSTVLDTAVYNVPVLTGKANFKRLTFDLGFGWELPVGGDIFLYAEARAWIPTTDYPSKYIFVNNNAPLVGMLNAGIRILFQ
jgi:hypothetical protein